MSSLINSIAIDNLAVWSVLSNDLPPIFSKLFRRLGMITSKGSFKASFANNSWTNSLGSKLRGSEVSDKSDSNSK